MVRLRYRFVTLLLISCTVFTAVTFYQDTFIYHEKIPMKVNLCDGKQQRIHQKVLSYSLFGNGTRWNSEKGEGYRGSVSILAKQIQNLKMYKDWMIRIYHDNGDLGRKTEADHIGNEQVQFCNIHKIKPHEGIKDLLGIFWRFLPMADETVDVSCFRDLDSDLTVREESAVSEWLLSKRMIHTMRDNPGHGIGILAGMWCFRNEMYQKIGQYLLYEIIRYAKDERSLRTDDQRVLQKVVWERFGHNSLQHDSYTCQYFNGSLPFPIRRENQHSFIGCAYHNCKVFVHQCPLACRPKDHPNWIHC